MLAQHTQKETVLITGVLYNSICIMIENDSCSYARLTYASNYSLVNRRYCRAAVRTHSGGRIRIS